MWFSIYRERPLAHLDIQNPVRDVAILIDSPGGGVQFYLHTDTGRPQAETWFSDLFTAQCALTDRYNIVPDMWVNAFDVHPLEKKPDARKNQMRHMVRCLAQACRPVGIIDYALRMSYDPKTTLEQFMTIRDLISEQVPYTRRHEFAVPYVRQAVIWRESLHTATMLYRSLTLLDEANAREVVRELEVDLRARGVIPS
jgi:hypothetical protein